MSSFHCEKCGKACIDSPRGYVTGCEHYPADIGPTVVGDIPITKDWIEWLFGGFTYLLVGTREEFSIGWDELEDLVYIKAEGAAMSDKTYRQFLPHIQTRKQFLDLCMCMLGPEWGGWAMFKAK